MTCWSAWRIVKVKVKDKYIAAANISKMVADLDIITIATKLEVTYVLSMSVFRFDLVIGVC